jgi:hypothetical protein
MTTLPKKTGKMTATGLSPDTDAFLAKLMKKNGMSFRRQKDLIDEIRYEGTLPRPPKPKPYKYETRPRPEQKVFTMARVGQRPLMKQEETILDETNWYEPEQAPVVPVGPSGDERKRDLVTKMWGVDEGALKAATEAERAALADLPPFTMEDQILDEIKGRTEWLGDMHDLGVHEHDGETLRQIDQRIDELKKRVNKKETLDLE